jgi:dihydroflavonol-4-reductase
VTTLLTGASGFVGAAVLRHLVAAGREVRVLLRPTSDRRNVADIRCEVAHGDLADPASLDGAVAGCEAVYHVAADYRLWVRDPAAMYRANVDGTRDLLRAAAAAGASRIVYCSSVAAIGFRPDGTPADETTVASVDDMVGHYKRSKYLAEREVVRLARDEGVPVVIVNPAAPFGPRDVKPTPTGRIVVEFARGRMPAYIDTGLNVVHVDDVAAGHLLAFERGRIGERYILGGDNMTLREILDILGSHLGRLAPRLRLPRTPLYPVALAAELAGRAGGFEPPITVDALRMAEHVMFYSSDKARRELGYKPRPGRAALTDAADWFKANGYF